jgi:hypothetical protein
MRDALSALIRPDEEPPVLRMLDALGR